MLAEKLYDRGLTQREVADLLGISQSAVSKYIHGDVAGDPRVREDGRVRELVDDLAEGLASGDTSPVGALIEIEVLIRRLERGDLLADLHEAEMPALGDVGERFDIHDPGGTVRAAEQTLASVRRGLRMLEHTDGFVTLIPNVGSNLVECLPDAMDVDDVAGVPGRLFAVKGSLSIPAQPEFGASEHVASVLLAARVAGSDARAALNVRYDEGLIADFVASGLSAVEFDAERDLETAIVEATVGTDDVDVLYQTGGIGIEPVAYVLAEDAEAAVTTIRAIS